MAESSVCQCWPTGSEVCCSGAVEASRVGDIGTLTRCTDGQNRNDDPKMERVKESFRRRRQWKERQWGEWHRLTLTDWLTLADSSDWALFAQGHTRTTTFDPMMEESGRSGWRGGNSDPTPHCPHSHRSCQALAMVITLATLLPASEWHPVTRANQPTLAWPNTHWPHWTLRFYFAGQRNR